jgi:hypothetical protein
MFPALIMLTDREGIFGVLIPFYFLYMAWDAYMTARSRATGEQVPDPLGINNLFGMENPKQVSTVDAAGNVSVAKGGLSGVPVGAVVLIGLGLLFLAGDYSRRVFENFIPVALIAIGVWRGIHVWERTAR